MYPHLNAPSLKNAPFLIISLYFFPIITVYLRSNTPSLFNKIKSCYLAVIYLTLCAIGNENLHEIT